MQDRALVGSGTVSSSGTPQGEAPPPPPPPPRPEEPLAGAVVNATPTGPPTPSNGWTVAYADAFGVPLGTSPGQDNTWAPSPNKDNGCCGNSNEIALQRTSQVSITPEGLKLKCEYLATEVSGKHYSCGGLRGVTARSPLLSYKGQTLAIQWKGRLPPNLGTADPGVWQDDASGNGEFDYPEIIGWGQSCGPNAGWSTCVGYYAWFFPPHPELVKRGFGGEPENKEHTYTTLMFPTSGGRYRYSVYVDGVFQKESPEVPPDPSIQAHLIITYGLRQALIANKFTSGSNSFTVRSLAVYIDAAHAGTGAVSNEGIVPGTTVK